MLLQATRNRKSLQSEWVRFNVLLDTLQVISQTVLQEITCTGTDNKN